MPGNANCETAKCCKLKQNLPIHVQIQSALTNCGFHVIIHTLKQCLPQKWTAEVCSEEDLEENVY